MVDTLYTPPEPAPPVVSASEQPRPRVRLPISGFILSHRTVVTALREWIPQLVSLTPFQNGAYYLARLDTAAGLSQAPLLPAGAGSPAAPAGDGARPLPLLDSSGFILARSAVEQALREWMPPLVAVTPIQEGAEFLCWINHSPEEVR